MALTTCKECGADVAKNAKTCPHCGIDRPGQRGVHVSAGMGCLIIIVAFGGLTMIIGGGDSDTWEPTPRTTPASLSARIWNTGTQIAVRNDDTFTWTDCRVTINPGLLGGGWSQEVSRVEPGAVISGGLLAFTRSGGERFQPSQYVVERVLVACTTPQGTSVYGATPTPGEPVASRTSSPNSSAPARVGVSRSEGRYVGDPLIRRYAPIGRSCANRFLGQSGAVFFATESQAIAAGYELFSLCD